MATMISEVYTAFRKAGVPEDEARQAAEALSSESVATKSDITRLEKEMIKTQGQINVIRWMIGLVLVVQIVPEMKIFFQ